VREGAIDRGPAFSPDGKNLVFIRYINEYSDQLFRVRLREGGTARGEPQPIGGRAWLARAVDWMADGRSVVVPALVGSHLQFWNVPLHGDPRRLPLDLFSDLTGPISIRGGRMAVATISAQLEIGRLVRRSGGGGGYDAAEFYGSSRSDSEPQLSPDGQRLVFASTRSGYSEIWRSNSDGSQAEQLSGFRGARTGSPRWSPDGRTVVFDAYRDGYFNIWAVAAAGGEPRQLTHETSNQFRPSCSHDGRWIYFGSDRVGQQVWKMPATGGAAEMVTHGGGFDAFESADGQWLYFTHTGHPGEGVYRMPVLGGAEETVVAEPAARAWAVAGDKLALGLERPARLVMVEPGSGHREEIFRFPEGTSRWPMSTSLTTSAGAEQIFTVGTRREESDILLVEGFR
jgi:WD40 repeat protein